MASHTIITFADENVQGYIPYLKQACDALDEKLVVYTPETTTFDESINDYALTKELSHLGLSKSPYKPNVILQALDELETNIIWMDTDAFPVKNIDIDWDFDAAFTLRPKTERNSPIPMWDGLINAGVSFWRNTDGAKMLLTDIADEVPKTRVGSDQEATSKVLCDRGWDKTWGDFNLGAKVRILKTEQWNCYHFPNIDQAKILHFKSPYKELYDQYFQQFYGDLVHV